MSEIIVKLTDSRIKLKGGEYVRDLIRCRDCKLWNDVELQVDGINHKCWGGCEFWKYQTDANDFCSYGERAGE